MNNAERLLAELKQDADQWGGALNEAYWALIETCPAKPELFFNGSKGALRIAIATYINAVERSVKDRGDSQ